MVEQHYRWDFIGLSTDQKPTPETSPKVVDGSTFYCADNSKLYVYCTNNWYERKPLGGGGGGTSDFEQLINRPKYNNATMTGETNIPMVINTAFTGTDGSADGTSGLVPAPATTDAGKFLKADGTWDTILGDTESYLIANSSWSALTSSDPYTYQTTVTATHTIGASTVAELLNDAPVTFANYGFAIGSISGQSVTIYSIGQPSSSVTLKVNYKG